jgi:hypothetical protein
MFPLVGLGVKSVGVLSRLLGDGGCLGPSVSRVNPSGAEADGPKGMRLG